MYNSNTPDLAIGIGGRVIRATGAGVLRIGDAVFFSNASGQVNKSTTAADYNIFAGICIGGDATGMHIHDHKTAPSSQYTVCSAAGKSVWILTTGIAWAYVSAAVTAPVRLGPPTTVAGELVTYTTGDITGRALTSVAAAGFVKIHLARG